MQRRRLVLIGNRASRRTDLLREAAGRVGVEVELVTWLDLVEGRADLRRVVRDGDVVRLDSPGKDFATEVAILRNNQRGEQFGCLVEERGRILSPKAWFSGFSHALGQVSRQLRDCPAHRVATHPADVYEMFSKGLTSNLLKSNGISVPPTHGLVGSYEEVASVMRDRRWRQVFLKLNYGSSASGAVAFRSDARGRVLAFTTVEIDGVDSAGEPKLYNTRRIRRLQTVRDIAEVVNALCPHGLHMEQWVPKAGIEGSAFDLRVVTIAGEPCHIVARLSRSPMTNLHLLNRRGDPSRVVDRVGAPAWHAAMDACRTAARVFSRSLMCGIDLMFEVGFHRHYVLEVNAFGDLLPGVLWNGMDTYEAQLRSLFDASSAEAA